LFAWQFAFTGLMFVLSLSLNAGATPVCADLFRPPALTADIVNLAKRLVAPRFDKLKFQRALADYEVQGTENLRQPKTREERLAFLHFVTNTSKRSPYELEIWAEKAKPKDLARLANSLGKLNLEKGFSPSKINSLIWNLYTFSATEPNSIRNFLSLKTDERDQIALEQWSTYEMASSSAVEAFEKLGLIKDQGQRGKWMDLIRSYPNALANINTGAMMVFESVIAGSPLSRPTYSKLRVTRLDPQMRERIEREGFDAVYPELKARYGHLARFDRGYFFARNAAAVGLMTYMVIHLFPVLVQALDLPPNLLNHDMNAVQVTETVAKYYSELGTSIVQDQIQAANERAAYFASRQLHSEGPLKAAANIDISKVSANRVTVTFDQQLEATREHSKVALAPPTSKPAPDGQDQMTKDLQDNLAYINSLDFSDPKSR
jgi:hypothetical protein